MPHGFNAERARKLIEGAITCWETNKLCDVLADDEFGRAVCLIVLLSLTIDEVSSWCAEPDDVKDDKDKRALQDASEKLSELSEGKIHDLNECVYQCKWDSIKHHLSTFEQLDRIMQPLECGNTATAQREELLVMACAMAQLEGPVGEPYRKLIERGEMMSKRKSTSPVSGTNKLCFTNSLNESQLPMYCGFAMVDHLPVAHCWNVDEEGNVVDTTPIFNESDVVYCGMPVDRSVARSVLDTSSHGNEFMDCWRSAVANADEDVVKEWRTKLGWHVSEVEKMGRIDQQPQSNKKCQKRKRQ